MAHSSRPDGELGHHTDGDVAHVGALHRIMPSLYPVIGIVMVILSLLIEAYRYRIYNLWRSRIRLIEEDGFANAYESEGVQHLC